MAVPKKKTSVSRKGMRHAGQHHKLFLNLAGKCPNCNSLASSHCACPVCGHYKGRQIFTVRVRKNENEGGSDNSNTSNETVGA